MSQKTKKQKIIAEQRRKLALLQQHLTPKEKVNSPPEFPHQNTSIYSYPIQEVRKDLTKTFWLCILAISLELALYFLFENNLTLPF